MSDYPPKEYAKDFIFFLSKFRPTEIVDSVLVSQNTGWILASPGYYNYLSFKTLICELFFRAINTFNQGLIREYTITCTNNKGVVKVVIGVSDDLDNQGEISIAKIITPTTIVNMNKDDVNAVYTANRTNYYNQIIVNEFITMLYGMDGDEPLISTSSISTKAFRKEY
jgi:hypothetical protein